MLVVDNNKMKLLRMKEKLLEVSPDNVQSYLDDFRALAVEIDEEVFASLLEHISNTNYHDLPFEEQIGALSEFVQEYDDVNELQCSFRDIYEKYAGVPLKLSDMSVISIDSIKDRISNIEGYLLNNSHVERNKDELEKLNLELIDEERRRTGSIEIFKNKETQLRNSFISVEGRVNGGEDTYISFVREFSVLSLDLKQLLLDSQQLDSELDKVTVDKALVREEYEAAKVCCNYIPSFENRETCEAIGKKLVFMDYKFTLLEMASLIAKDFAEYDSVKLKRDKLKMFNEMRIECLHKLGVTLLVDPFDSLKIDEQLKIIESYADNKERIDVIRRKITNVNALLENRLRQNTEFMIALNGTSSFINDKTTFETVKDEASQDDSVKNMVLPSQVVKVGSVSPKFMLDRAREKTNSVIRKVGHLYVANNDSVLDAINPDLVVLPSVNPNENVDDTPSLENKSSDEVAIQFPELIDVSSTMPVISSDSDNLFQDVVPFNEATLFDNKYDDVFNDNEVNDAVPINVSDMDNKGLEDTSEKEQNSNAFWVTKDDDYEEVPKPKRR